MSTAVTNPVDNTVDEDVDGRGDDGESVTSEVGGETRYRFLARTSSST